MIDRPGRREAACHQYDSRANTKRMMLDAMLRKRGNAWCSVYPLHSSDKQVWPCTPHATHNVEWVTQWHCRYCIEVNLGLILDEAVGRQLWAAGSGGASLLFFNARNEELPLLCRRSEAQVERQLPLQRLAASAAPIFFGLSPRAIATAHEAKAVMFDFVEPARAGRRHLGR